MRTTGCPVHAPGLSVAVTPPAPPGTSVETGELSVNAHDGSGSAWEAGGLISVRVIAATAGATVQHATRSRGRARCKSSDLTRRMTCATHLLSYNLVIYVNEIAQRLVPSERAA